MFVLKDHVRIKQLLIWGRVKAIHQNESGTSFLVRYFDNAEPREVYFDLDELESIEQASVSPRTGFATPTFEGTQPGF